MSTDEHMNSAIGWMYEAISATGEARYRMLCFAQVELQMAMYELIIHPSTEAEAVPGAEADQAAAIEMSDDSDPS